MKQNWRILAGKKGGLVQRKYHTNVNFFKEWNPQMAYILGFIFSDGNIHNGTLRWDIQTRDKKVLEGINACMSSNYPIKTDKRGYTQLKINSVIIVDSLSQLGVIPNKSKCCKFPEIPNLYMRDFIRGILDGDGWITAQSKRNEICTGFCSGSFSFLKELSNKLIENLSLTTHNLRERKKKTRKGKISYTYSIEWYASNAIKIISYLYDDLKENDLYLQRKFNNQIKAREIYEKSRRSKLWRKIEQRFKVPMAELLNELFNNQKLTEAQIAKRLNVHSSSVNRWLERTHIKTPVKKIRKIIFTTCLVCDKLIRQKQKPFKKYCSSNCRSRRSGKIVNCAICNKEIYRAKWWFKVNTTPVCSKGCMREWQSMRIRKNLLPRCKTSGRFLPVKSGLNE